MKIGLISLGCPKNLVDSEVMLGLARQAGHELTPDAHDADVVIVNTCAFIDRAKQESIDTILEIAELKAKTAGKRLVVTGCMAERYRDDLKKEIPEIDAVLGTGEVPRILEVLNGGPAKTGASGHVAPLTFYRRDDAAGRLKPAPTAAEAERREAGQPALSERERVEGSTADRRPTTNDAVGLEPAPVFGLDLPTYIYDADTPRVLATPGHYAYVKIAEGCDYKCAFCVIPKMRGHYRSRTVESIVREAHQLAAQGVKELLLVSQDTTFYGIDRQERGALPRLLRALNEVDGLEWVRPLYLYPTTITDETLDAIAECDKVVKYIDLPLQHASDRMLARMKRPGTGASYEKLLARIRHRIRMVTLRTTFIVGFPGETDADVAELERFITAVGFDHVGIFTYSHEEGTSAFGFEDDVPARVKERRRNRLMGVQKKIVARAQKRRLGDRVRLVVDGPAPDHELVLRGRLAGQAPEIDPVVYLTECDPSALPAGTFVDAELVGSRGYDLVARPLP